jgi:hypothetical protein
MVPTIKMLAFYRHSDLHSHRMKIYLLNFVEKLKTVCMDQGLHDRN